MNGQLMLEAERARDAAIVAVDQAADPDWKDAALEAVRQTCLARATFICDDVWEVGQLDSTREDRALGPVMQRAARNGWCRRTDRTRPSVRSHGSPKPLWASLIHQGEAAA